MNWSQLNKRDRLWINGNRGEVKSIEKTYKDNILTSVIIRTYIYTRKLLIGKYTGPSIYFYRPEKGVELKKKPGDEPLANLEQYYEKDDDIVSEDGSVIISLSEKNAGEIKKKLEEIFKSRKLSYLTEQISSLEEEIETKKEKIIELKKEIEDLARLEN